MQERPQPAQPVASERGDKGPRFAVRFDPRGGEIALARPLAVVDGVVLEALVAGVGRPRAPVVLSGGALRLRHRRSELRSVRLSVDVRTLEALGAARGLALRIVRADGTRVLACVQDAWGPLAVEVLAIADGEDVGLALVDVRAASAGPSSGWSRALAALTRAGLPLDEATGLVRLARPLDVALRFALAPHGWRVPRTAGATLSLEARTGRVVLAAPSSTTTSLAARDEAAGAASVLRALAVHDAERARAALVAGPPPALRSPTMARLDAALAVDVGEHDAVARVASLPATAPLGALLALRLALAADDAAAALAAARRVDELEAVDEVAIDALVRAAELHEVGSRARLDLFGRAARRTGARTEVRASAAAAAASAGDAGELAALLTGAASAGHEIAAAAVIAAARVVTEPAAAGRAAAARDVLDVIARLLAVAPEDPHVLAVAARAAGAGGDPQRAALLHARAARAHETRGDTVAAARSLATAAKAHEAEGAAGQGGELLARAAVLDPRPATLAALGNDEARRGDPERAAATFGRLLALAGEDGLADALVDAAQFHLGRGDAQAARTFVDALARSDPSHASLTALRARITAGLADAWSFSPERLAGLDAFLLAEVARESTAPSQAAEALLGALGLAGSDAAALVAAAQVAIDCVDDAPARAALLGRLAALAVLRATELSDADTLLALESHAATADDHARLLERAATLQRSAGLGGKAARSLARAAVVRRDAAGLRAALDLAERAGAIDDALAIVRSALEVVGDGPAREGLLRRAEALGRAKGA